jgi:hypothetical protein
LFFAAFRELSGQKATKAIEFMLLAERAAAEGRNAVAVLALEEARRLGGEGGVRGERGDSRAAIATTRSRLRTGLHLWGHS